MGRTMRFTMTSDDFELIGFAFIGLLGLIVFIAGVVLLFRRSSSAPPGPKTKAAGFGVKIQTQGPAELMLISGIILLIGGAYFAEHTHSQQTGLPTDPPSTSSASPTSAASPTAASEVPFASVTYPRSGLHVSRKHGFTMGGRVTDPGQYTVWILDHPAGYYFVDVVANVTGGTWAATDQQIGDATDILPYSRAVVAVIADPHCARVLNRATGQIGSLPSGCHQFGRVIVDVTRP